MKRALGVLLIVASGLTAVGRAEATAACISANELADPGRSVPVLLVHGFTGSKDDMALLGGRLAELLGSKVSVSYFDYKAHNTDWVTDGGDESIATRLRTAIDCLASASKAAGGPGQIAVIAHSMGGLATRAALDGSTGRVALVVTLGTPNNGSYLAGRKTNNDVELSARQAALGLLHAVTRWIPGVGALVGNLNTPATEAMAIGSRQLAALPAWSPSIPVYAVGGNVELSLRYFFWTKRRSIGDLVVPVASAQARQQVVGGLGGTDTQTCGVEVPLEFEKLGAAVVTALQAKQIATCYHGFLTTQEWSMSVVTAQVAALTRRLLAPPPPRVVDCEGVDFSGIADRVPFFVSLERTVCDSNREWALLLLTEGQPRLTVVLAHVVDFGTQYPDCGYWTNLNEGPPLADQYSPSEIAKCGVPSATAAALFAALGGSRPALRP